MKPVFRALEVTAKTAVRATGTKITYRGLERLPASGGAVVAINQPNTSTSCLPRWQPASASAVCGS